MNWFSHKIANPVGSTQTWDQWVEKFLNKQASEAKPECDDDPRGQCRGQVINNDNEPEAHSYQEGESVDGKPDQKEGTSVADTTADADTEIKKAAEKSSHCTKDMGECSKAGDVTEDHSDAGNADVGNAAVEQNINNDPNYQKGESTNPGKVDGKKKKTDNSGKESSNKKTTKTSNSRKGFKKIACLNRVEKLGLFKSMTSKQTKSGSPAWPISYVEAMVGLKFSNMKDDEKAWFREFWLTMYPNAYVEEMVADR